MDKYKGIPRYKGVIPLGIYKHILLSEMFKGTFCEHNMEHKQEVSKALDRYLAHYKKGSKAFKKCHKTKITPV